MKAILLDMYGVIVKQTGDDFVPYIRQFFPDIEPEEIYDSWFRADVGEISSLKIWEAIGFEGDLEAVEKAYLDTIELNDGFMEFVTAARNRYKLAVVSNDTSRWSRYLREKFDINKYFDVISISGDLGIRKPDERIFLLTAEKLGCSADDCIYIDDRRKNLNAAARLGMRPILLNSRNMEYDGTTVNSFYELMDLLL